MTATAAPSKQELEDCVAELQQRIADALAPYEAESATHSWLDSLRWIEECINLMTVEWNDDVFERRLFAYPVLRHRSHAVEFQEIRRRFVSKFSEQFANRFCNLVILGSAIGLAFAAHRAHEAAAGFATVGSMVGYLQSRRRHFVGLLHFLPTACRGSQSVTQSDALNIFLPIVEFSAVPMMGAQYNLMVKLAQERLGIPADVKTELAMLDALCLEPERAPIIAMEPTDEGFRLLATREAVAPDRLFSAAELRNDIVHIEAAYAEFDLGATEFGNAASLVRRLSVDYIERDFWIKISPADLTSLMGEVGASPALRSALTGPVFSYMNCLSSYSPLLLLNAEYFSTVTLLSRFMYSWRARVLDRRKRFQIRAGFIFEDQVKDALSQHGFTVHNIVRINRQEFDVVTTRDDVVWNIQCKNNFIDLDRVDSDANSFARYNSALVRAYERALVKERNREQLLKKTLSRESIEHIVVSRFPVITNNPRIVVFSRIDSFARDVDTLLVKPGPMADPQRSSNPQ